MLDKLHILTSLTAGIIFTVVTILLGYSIYFWLPNIILIIIIFYILGLIIRRYFRNKVFLDENIERDYSKEDNEDLEVERGSILDKFDEEDDDDI